MSTSPYVPVQVKEYMRKFNIEENINSAVNDLLRNMPEDPYSYLVGLFQKKSTPDIEVLDILMNEKVSADGFPVISLRIKINYLNQILDFTLEQPYGISSDNNNVFDSESKGMKSGISFYNEKIRPVLKSRKFKCSEQQLIDSQLVKAYSANQKKGLYQINNVSFSIPALKSRIFCRPSYKVYSQLTERQIQKDEVPKLFINCLRGGKVIGSKCKVFNYYVLTSNLQGLPLAQTVLQNIKKTITSGKGGEAALKYSADGTFICPVDTIMDNLKIVQEAISSTPGAKDHLKIGLSWQADTLFNADTKKYELQNPKTPFDNDQMIEYLLKLLTDKPIITYLEDPLASTQLASWSKLKKRIKQNESLKHVKIGARSGNLLNPLSQQFKEKLNQVSLPLTEDSEVPTEQREAKNAIKFSLDYLQVRLFQLQTLTNVLKVYKSLQKVNTKLILQDNSYETSNSEIVDICFGLGAVCNIGSLAKYDRLSKIYRAIEIVKEVQNPI